MNKLYLILALLIPQFALASSAVQSNGSGSQSTVLTKTTSYSMVPADFGSASYMLLECNCSSACTQTLPLAVNMGFTLIATNIGSATCTLATTGSDTFGSTTDTTWVLTPGGSPQMSNEFIANGGSRWNGL